MPDGTKVARPHYLQTELEELVRTNPAMWEFIQQSSLDGVWYWDLENPDNEWMSPEFWRLFGIDPATKQHDPVEWQDLIFKEDLETAVRNLEAHCADPDHPYDQTVRYRHADGSTVWVRCRGIAIRDDNGKPIRMLGAHNAVTEVKVARNENEMLLAANRELESVAYALSHDLKSPVITIRMLTEEMIKTQFQNLDEDGRTLATMLEQTAARAHRLVDALLAYAAVVSDPLTLSKVKLGRLAKRVCDDLAPEIQRARAKVVVDDLPTVWANPSQIKSLLAQLIANAVIYAEPGTPNAVRVWGETDEDGSTLVHVSDTGIGIPVEHQERVFDMFQRLHREEDYPGHGLGLALAQRVARNHGGSITVCSEPGQGATFTFTLPRRDA